MASLMIQGTTSDAGKSILVAGLCRVFKRRGYSVAPFKPQNMALNSAVTLDGGEIGRAQALQAVACGLELHTDFNPVLLKPSSDMNSQVIINGKAVSQLEAKEFGNIKALAFQSVLEAYQRLTEQYQVVLIEGAGSPAEVNLRNNDIANMGFAEEVDCPVILVSDIDRGGVFAHLTGTLNILSASEQNRIKGFVINKFRGHLKLLQGGLNWLEQNTSKPVFGVLPYLQDLKLDAEDAVPRLSVSEDGLIIIKVIVLPRISNHTDFEPLSANPKINFEYVREASQLSGADLVIIPGTKNVRDDLEFIHHNGWTDAIKKHCRYGGKLLGICGGFQMLGEQVSDPLGIESAAGETGGLGLLAMTTELQQHKDLKRVSGEYKLAGKTGKLSGYEIHCGHSKGEALNQPFCFLQEQNNHRYSDGAISNDQQIVGTYLHGLFENKTLTESILSWASGEQISGLDWQAVRESELDRLADTFEQHLDISSLLECLKLGKTVTASRTANTTMNETPTNSVNHQ
jgi:adenosylcobyric acid synthase